MRYLLVEDSSRTDWLRWGILDNESRREVWNLSRWEARQCVGWMNADETIALHVFT